MQKSIPLHWLYILYSIVYIYIYCIYWIYLIYCKHCIFVPKSCIPCSTSELSAALDWGAADARQLAEAHGHDQPPNAEKSLQMRIMNSYAWCQDQIFLDPFSLGCFDSAISVRSRRRRSARCKELWQTSERTWTQRLSSPNIFCFFVLLFFLDLIFNVIFDTCNGFDTDSSHAPDNSHRRRLAEPPSWGDLEGFKPRDTGRDCPIFQGAWQRLQEMLGSHGLERFEAAFSDLLGNQQLQTETVWFIEFPCSDLAGFTKPPTGLCHVVPELRFLRNFRNLQHVLQEFTFFSHVFQERFPNQDFWKLPSKCVSDRLVQIGYTWLHLTALTMSRSSHDNELSATWGASLQDRILLFFTVL